MERGLHVIQQKNNWIVMSNGFIHSIHTDKNTAVKVAKIIAHNVRAELIIHRRNGDILKRRP
jgi:hypothetical protein